MAENRARVTRYATHPEVVVDPETPVPQWRLSDYGRRRAERFAAKPDLARTTRIACSDETKAMETAQIVARQLGVAAAVRGGLHENDRSATGYLPEAEFFAVAKAFFDRPHESVRGWERAADAQARVLRAVDAFLAEAPDDDDGVLGDVLIVGHGGVGALLLCALSGGAIGPDWGQPMTPERRGGFVFAFDIATKRVTRGWEPID